MRKLEAVQFFSSEDIRKVRKFIGIIRKYYKSGGIEFFGEVRTEFSDDEQFCLSFAYLALTQNQVRRWHVDDGLEVLINEEDAKFHESPECMIFLDLLLGGDIKNLNGQSFVKGKAAKREVNKLIVSLRKAIESVFDVQSKINIFLKKEAEINFWGYEYTKRRFIQDISADNEYAKKVQRLFEEMNKTFKLLDNSILTPCGKCLWRKSKRDNYGDWPFVFKDMGCGGACCKFKVFCSHQVEYVGLARGLHDDGSAPYFMAIAENVNLGWKNYTIDSVFCFELVEKYGLYPYELFSLADSNLINNILISNEVFPEREFYSGILRGNQCFKPVKTFAEEAFEGAKRGRVVRQNGEHAKYRSENRARMIGLFLWDEINFVPEKDKFSFLDACKKLCLQDWFGVKVKEKKLCELISDGYDEYEIQDELNYYKKLRKRTGLCIEQGKVLPLNSVR
ncbi:hypothetical protein [Desulfovibrio sp. JC022]|uniref:hypothetical protein n=1 Tax=Desulfovibrio sp. JC022 TaxID=2593642 RepID=UPI0013D776B4|nr:hypothetical protein [Desulfovibrio sp. JC022]NDV24827.1 hypothetical protein [Desulfovibrio sp. JC022]